MKIRWGWALGWSLGCLLFIVWGGLAQEQGASQKRILMERAEKVRGQRLELVRRVIESYQDCRVLSEGNELTGLIINGKAYQDFSIVIRDAKKTIVVFTADGVVSFDY